MVCSPTLPHGRVSDVIFTNSLQLAYSILTRPDLRSPYRPQMAGKRVRAQTEQSLTNTLTAQVPPIELQTENGFSILRRWEIDGKHPPNDDIYVFIVRNPQGAEHEVVVSVTADLVAQTQVRTRNRIEPGNTFWICCAERHLASHLWEKSDFPVDNRLTITELDREDVMLALRWRRS